ncbi:hypothetical protein N9U93_02260 [Candidatus Pelagibacter sp.]|nr:hypothetical protein [Candidatus Pelagibacter sp.]
MDNIFNNRYFLLIKKKKILFKAFDSNHNEIFSKDVYLYNHSMNDIFTSIENFLEKNVIEIEKKLKHFIKKIFIIFDSDLFFVTASSVKFNFQKNNFQLNEINDRLLEVRNQFKKYSTKDEIIHMIIEKYIIDGIDYIVLPEDIKSKELIIQVNFICLNEQIIEKFKTVLSKYEISLNKIFSFNYLDSLEDHKITDIFKIADQSITGFYNNEIFLTKKSSKNLGFFEKFFNFFN